MPTLNNGRPVCEEAWYATCPALTLLRNALGREDREMVSEVENHRPPRSSNEEVPWPVSRDVTSAPIEGTWAAIAFRSNAALA